jgi:DNA-binding NarL/FixJ family response regulator
VRADRPVAEVIRVLLVDDHAVVRRGLRAFVETEPALEVVGEASDGQQALDLLREWHTLAWPLPHVVLMDLRMPRMDGTEATKRMSADYPTVRVVILTSFGEAERVQGALTAGAAGYLLKDAEPAEVAAAIRAAAAGEVHLDSAVAGQLVRRMAAPRIGLTALTPREREILTLIAQGHANRTIAEKLVISERTARTHVSNVLGKLQLSSRTQAALLAIREGLIPPPS